MLKPIKKIIYKFSVASSPTIFINSVLALLAVAVLLFLFVGNHPVNNHADTSNFAVVSELAPVEFTLRFNANTDGLGGTDGSVSNLPESESDTVVASAARFTIPVSVPTRSNYIFSGWNTEPDGTGTSYLGGVNITVIGEDDDPYSAAATLYAIWTQEPPSFYTITTMQEMTSSICGSATTPSASVTDEVKVDTTGVYIGSAGYVPQRILTDTRDNNTYTVRKLADGNCWTTENLKFELLAGKEVIIASATDDRIATWTPELNIGDFNNAVAMNGNTRENPANEVWYYSWYAATGGSGTALTGGNIAEDAPYSICPQNWRLPSAYSLNPAKSYGALTNAYGITKNGLEASTMTEYAELEAFPLDFMRFSRYGSGKLDNIGNGFYWSSTASSSTNAFYFYYAGSYVNTQYSYVKHGGSPVRCIAQ